ncbi:hypothetical protein T06_9190 [Trichinella sp. T6]|nr:hypothetical protein T06_9190 [Trichinella sp. T6]
MTGCLLNAKKSHDVGIQNISRSVELVVKHCGATPDRQDLRRTNFVMLSKFFIRCTAPWNLPQNT